MAQLSDALGVPRALTTLAATAVLSVLSLLQPSPSHAGFAEAQNILETGTIGGTRGLRLRQIGGANEIYSWNSNFEFYPASTIKALQHLYSMHLVDQGPWDLIATGGLVCTTADENCTSLANLQAGCSVVGENLQTILSGMMRNSSNHRTNTIQERIAFQIYPFAPPFSHNMASFGRNHINAFASTEVGMTNTAINHKFGCGGYCGNDPANVSTLRDLERLYRAAATDPDVLSPAGRVTMKNLMLNEGDSFINDIIDDEAQATGKNGWADAFRGQIFMMYKSGSWTCSGKTYRSTAGLIQLPTHNGAYKRLFTFGGFTHDSESWAYLPGTVGDTVAELLRGPIRAALLTWGFDLQYHVIETNERVAKAVLGAPAATQRAVDAELKKLDRAADNNRFADVVAALDASRATFASLAKRHVRLRGLDADLVQSGRSVAEDGVAMATATGNSPELGARLVVAEGLIADGDKAMLERDSERAMQSYQKAAAIADELAILSDPGIPQADRDIGFVPEPAATL